MFKTSTSKIHVFRIVEHPCSVHYTIKLIFPISICSGNIIAIYFFYHFPITNEIRFPPLQHCIVPAVRQNQV
jgi:hypothetical protein